jgi:TPR repeat protein
MSAGNAVAENVGKKRAWAVLKKIAWHAAINIPIAGPAFECLWDVRDAFYQTGEEEKLAPEQTAQLLSQLEPEEAEQAVGEVLATPEARQSTARLSPAQQEELRQRLMQLPMNFRLLPAEDEAGVNKVLMGERPRRFNVGDRTADRQYTLEKFLGFGGFGEVWAAQDFHGERRAIKFCLDDQALGSLETEFNIVLDLCARLSERERQGFLRFYPCNLHCDTPYLVAELCEGDLLTQMRPGQQPLAPERCLALLLDPLRALARAHEAGIVHRDIKPANILLSSDGKARLADFGLARAVVERHLVSIVHSAQSRRSSQARGAGIAGTALYMAPEVKRGEVKTDNLAGLKRGDVYSFGVALAQLLAGDSNLEGGRLPRRLRQDLPNTLVDLVEEATEPNAADRLAHAGEALKRIELIVARQKPLEAMPAQTSTRQASIEQPIKEELRSPSVPVKRVKPTPIPDLLAQAIDLYIGLHGNKINEKWAVLLFEEAAKTNDPRALLWLARLRHKGRCGFKEEVSKAQADAKTVFLTILALAQEGDPEATFLAGSCFNDALAVDQDYAEAVRLYRAAADLGHATAMLNLGGMYDNGQGVHQEDDAEAACWYRKAADLGHAGAMRNLGVMYANGRGVRQDDAEAVRLWHGAADLGDAGAMRNLGIMYDNGRGVRQDDAEAVRWYRAAADKGDACAMRNLGIMYDNGRGVRQDDAEAVRWYRAAADKGDADAMCNLGFKYDNGRGVRQDDAEAVRWYRAAADKGNAYAMCNLGIMYDNGRGVRQDDAEAVRLYRAAADKGNADAMCNLGIMYDNGRGVRQDNDEAMRLYRAAADLGNTQAINIIQEKIEIEEVGTEEIMEDESEFLDG